MIWKEEGLEPHAGVESFQQRLVEKDLLETISDILAGRIPEDVNSPEVEEIEIGPDKKPGLRVQLGVYEFDIHISQTRVIS